VPTNTPRCPDARPRRRGTELVACDELVRLLNDDFAREYRSIFAHAVYAERLRAAGRPDLAAVVEKRGKLEVEHALSVCRVVYDFGGSVVAPVDELNAVLNADRVADPCWLVETARRLRERARQLRAIGEPGLAKRLTRIAAAKLAAPQLAALAAEIRNPKHETRNKSKTRIRTNDPTEPAAGSGLVWDLGLG
jgi:hypothetical protein